ncbi:hypothetical protein THASP1DRAFT_28892 [Thamnocephalis sphaerospora]|uniref:Swiss Army Knife RNA repair protein HAD domain-containing protein n=1 Tax=Thamnocephalis sphaerospora TaxID=78915 RepID=A0A4P9XUQ2_9FUNG|nr:hypothetical protein THASP1DRAFT_28892 [Thamnocephalis sphaerospora]|eukprot:RKP09311.1 hypothetical protein THASP1DRAFT_28892 [Thamnocephalis sphaerospora]
MSPPNHSDPAEQPPFLFAYENDLTAALASETLDYRSVKIFDFDNTLFKSPLPNPRLWHHSLAGRLMSPEVGWFHDVRTLSEPFVVCRGETTDQVPSRRGSSNSSNAAHWFAANVLHEARTAIAASDTFTVLLTGRLRSVYYARIVELLTTQQLQFNMVILRENNPSAPYPTTMTFKKDCVQRLLSALPLVRTLTLWEDRPAHAAQFQAWLEDIRACGRLDQAAVVHVKPNVHYMALAQEKQLVHALIADYNARTPRKPLQTETRLLRASLHLSAASITKLYTLFDVPADHPLPSQPANLVVKKMPAAECLALTARQRERIRLTATRGRPVHGRPTVLLTSNRPHFHVLYHMNAPLPAALPKDKDSLPTVATRLRIMGALRLQTVLGVRQPSDEDKPLPVGQMIVQQHPRLHGKALQQACIRLSQELKARGIANRRANAEQVKQVVVALDFESHNKNT